MGSVGQAVGGIVGGVVGGYLGGASGATFGFSLGMTVGSFIDPPKGARQAVEYKRTDLFYDTIAHNMPVPIVYGVNRVGGNLLWLHVGGTVIEDGGKSGSGGGKSSSADTGQSVKIHVDWALALSEGPITAVAEVFVGDKSLSWMEGIAYTAYLGTATQLPDPLLTTDLESLAPAFRNTAYLVMGSDLGSPNVPVINAEISGVLGTPAGDPYSGANLWQAGFVSRSLVQADGSFLAASATSYVWRSTDYGRIWTEVGCGMPHDAGYVSMSALGEHRGVAGRAYFAHYTYPMGNIYVHRSDDYGKTWPNTSNVIPIGFDVGAVFGVEANSSEVLLFTRGYLGSYDDYQAGIWRSTDGGDNFSLVNYLPMHTPYQGITAVVQLPGTDTIFAMEQAPTVGGGMLWKSNDRGASWGSEVGISAVPDGGFTYGQNIVGFCGNDENRAKGQCRVSFDGGVIWTTYDICDEAIMSARINSFGLLVAATHVHNYPGRYTQGGPRIYYSATLGVTWHQINLDLSYNHYGMLGLDQQCLFLTTEHVCFGSGVGGYVTCANFTTPTSCGNPALIIQDLLNNTRYGLGISSFRIDIESIRSASAYCTAQVPSRLSSGHMEQRFCLDYVVDQSQPIVDHLRDMLATFGGYLCWSQGKVKLKIDMPASSTVQSFGMNEIVKDSFQWKKQSLRVRPNVLRVDYVDPGNTVVDATGETANSDLGRYIVDMPGNTANISVGGNYKTYKHDFVESSDPWDIELTGERRERTINLTGVKRRSQAQRMAEYYLARALYCQHACSFKVGINALRAEVGDVIAVSHDIPGWYGKQFRIVEISEEENDELALGCLEYSEDIYRHTPGAVPGQDPIWGHVPSDWTAPPYNVGRLTAYERPNEGTIEVAYTRIATNDLFGGTTLYRRIGETGAWLQVGVQVSNAPTAYLASHTETITLVES